MKERFMPGTGSVIVLSAAAATGHLRAADALVKAFDIRGVSARRLARPQAASEIVSIVMEN
jgi:hypothetical protein